MNTHRLQDIFNAYGADPQRWPAAERDTAEQYLAHSSEAQVLHAQAQALDHQLDALPEVVEPLGLAQRIIALSAEQPQAFAMWERLQYWLLGNSAAQHILRPALMLGLPLLLGVWLGMHSAHQAFERMEQQQFAALAEAEWQYLLEAKMDDGDVFDWGDEAL